MHLDSGHDHSRVGVLQARRNPLNDTFRLPTVHGGVLGKRVQDENLLSKGHMYMCLCVLIGVQAVQKSILAGSRTIDSMRRPGLRHGYMYNRLTFKATIPERVTCVRNRSSSSQPLGTIP